MVDDVRLPPLPADLLLLCPYTLPTLLYCPECGRLASSWRRDRKFDWARVLYCSCGKDWVVCADCRKCQQPMTSKPTLRMHNRNCHSRKSNSPVEDDTTMPGVVVAQETKKRSNPGEADDIPELVEKKARAAEQQDEAMEEQTWEIIRKSPHKQKGAESLLFAGGEGAESLLGDDNKAVAAKRTLFQKDSITSLRDFGNANSSSYFNADINGNGLADIVGKCQFQMSDVGKDLHPADVQYTTDIANFVHGLTHVQRGNLANILGATVAKIHRDTEMDGDSKNEARWKTSIPTNPQMLRSQIWEGRQAFLGNIPYVTVEQVAAHAYCSLRACIRDRLAFGFPLEKVELRETNDRDNPVRTTMQSEDSQCKLQVCMRRYKEPVLVLFLKEWQDGYDPHSFSKTNRGSCWVKLITIAEPHDHRNSPEVRNHQMNVLFSLDKPN
jgi:hypothetical protein